MLQSRVFFLLLAFIASSSIHLQEGYLGKQVDNLAPYWVWIWANFDGRHFLDIVTNGYQNFNFAFFPLYPLLVYLLNIIFKIPSLYAGILISLVSFYLGLWVVYKIIRIDYPERLANFALILLSFFPLAFFYQAVYPDSLFLLLSTSSFYFARRGRWHLAGVFGGLTVLTRLSGLALLPALAVEWYLQNEALFKKKKFFISKKSMMKFLKTGFIALSLTGLGIIIYMMYLQIFFGDFLLFQKSMIAWHQQRFIMPAQTIFRYIKILIYVDKHLLVYWIAILELATTILYIALSIFVLKKVRLSYGVFMLVLLALISFTGVLAGTPRYILHLFPGFLGLALLIKDRKHVIFITGVIYLILGFLLTGLFTRGYFVS
ncbi:glycosyltransferase family 39 protein [Candidatus Microgenomates bacterium]|nr:glycosyltransferase family 39 protein [Candidatus Microgenomates bacterium]